jgi:hypothetical protein
VANSDPANTARPHAHLSAIAVFKDEIEQRLHEF